MIESFLSFVSFLAYSSYLLVYICFSYHFVHTWVFGHGSGWSV